MTDIATQGHNNPPSNAEMITSKLSEDYAILLNRKTELLEGFERTPETVEDKETCGKMIDFVKQLKLAAKKTDQCRDDEKRPHLEAGNTIQAWFKGNQNQLLDAVKELEGRITVYQRKVADEERKRREEQERIAREEQAKADRLAKEAEEAMQSDEGLENAIAAEEFAQEAQKVAESANNAVNANSTSMSRQHSESGASASLSTFWDCKITDMAIIDLNALRNHINPDVIERAVKASVKAGVRIINGVKIFENTQSTVR